MVLNASRLMPALRSRYCGIALYLSNSACQDAASSGGSTPVTGFHSTIESPDSVSRVAPPTTTVTTISAATASSHSLTARRCAGAGGGTLAMRMRTLPCWRRRGPYSSPAAAAIARGRPMPIRLRKLIGAVALIALVVTWALVAMALAQAPAIKTNGLIEVVYYVVAGLGWVLPAMPLIRWMSRPDAT